MGAIDEIFIEYTRMRENGLDSKATLRALRPYIEPLAKDIREELALQVRAWETGRPDMANDQLQGKRPEVIKSLDPNKTATTTSSSAIRKLVEQTAQAAQVAWTNCPSCGKKNRTQEVFCYACGHLLEPGSGQGDTQLFNEAEPGRYSGEYFGADSILLLEIRDMRQSFEIRPQQREHELVIGRSTENSAMMPDIDLAQFGGAEHGVSRLHMALDYDREANLLEVRDLGSANGSFINGQRLHPKEVRVLRHDDEIRLGRFVLRIYYHHPGDPIN